MLDLDTKKKKSVPIKIGGVVYELESPNLDAMILIGDMDTLKGSAQIKVLKDFLVHCGVPAKVCGKLDGDQVTALSEYLQSKTKKK